MMPWLSMLCDIAACLALAAIAIRDVAARTVSNAMLLGLAGVGCVLAISQKRLLVSCTIGVAILILAAVLWLRGYMGGADTKLLAAAGIVVPPASVPLMLVATALAGGLLSAPYAVGPRLISSPAPARPASLGARVLRCEQWRLRRGGPLPYAVAIAAGTIFALLHGA